VCSEPDLLQDDLEDPTLGRRDDSDDPSEDALLTLDVLDGGLLGESPRDALSGNSHRDVDDEHFRLLSESLPERESEPR